MKPTFYGLLLLVFSLAACSGASSSSDSKAQEEAPAPPPPNEDDLLMRLSAEMTTDTSRTARDQNAIIDHAIENLINVQPTASGLFYEVLAPGEGDPIQWGDFLVAHYRGYFLNGKEFANSRRRDQPLEFYVGNMIDAWNEGLQLIAVGGKIRLLVPSHLAYGEEGLQTKDGDYLVPPNQILAFDVEVLEKKDTN